MEEQTKRNWGLIIGGVIAVMALCALTAWAGFAFGQRTADPVAEPLTATEAIAEILSPTSETAVAAETDTGTSEGQEQALPPSSDNAAAGAPMNMK